MFNNYCPLDLHKAFSMCSAFYMVALDMNKCNVSICVSNTLVLRCSHCDPLEQWFSI